MRLVPSAEPAILFDGGQALAAGNGFALLPNSLCLAAAADGRPDFHFDYIRRDDRSAAIYGLLSFRVSPAFPRAQDVAAFRAAHAGALIQPLAFTGGFLRLMPTGPLDLPAEMLHPQPLLWNELDRARIRLQMHEAAAQLVGGLLENGTLSMFAYAEMDYAVRVPGLPLIAEFDPAELLAALLPPAGTSPQEREIGLNDLAVRLGERGASLPIRWQGTLRSSRPEQVAAILAALIQRYLGSPIPAPRPDGQGHIRLSPAVASGRMIWDLSRDIETSRVLCLSLNPFEALAPFAGHARVSRVTVPPMRLGRCTVTIAADPPPGTTTELAVVLTAPPHPPQRPAAVVTPLIVLRPPTYTASAMLRFSPAETSPAYTVATYALLPGGVATDGIARPCPLDPARLFLEADDFPACFVTVEVDEELARGAVITGTAAWGAERQDFALGDNRVLTLCLPKQEGDGALTLLAEPRDGIGCRVTMTLPLRSVRLDPSGLPGFGRHRQTARCVFPPDFRGALLLEVTGEESEAATALRLSPTEPEQSFSWHAASAFRPGYRFRRRGDKEWSPARPPAIPLLLTVDPVSGAVAIDPRESMSW